MITNQPQATTSAVVEDPVLQEQLTKIEALKAELTSLKQDSAEKQAQIVAIEKECGLTPWVKFQAKVKPVSKPVAEAFESAAKSARPVIKQASEKISEATTSLMKRAKSTSKPEDENGNAAVDEAPAAVVGTDEPAAEDKEVKAEPTEAEKEAAAEAAKEQAALAEAKMQESLKQIAEVKAAVAELNIQIKNKESEIAWLEKKAGLNTGPLGKFGTAMEPHLLAAKQGLSEAKVKTGEKLGVAKKETKRLWGRALLGATKMRQSMMQKVSKDGEGVKAKQSSGGADEDFEKRYA